MRHYNRFYMMFEDFAVTRNRYIHPALLRVVKIILKLCIIAHFIGIGLFCLSYNDLPAMPEAPAGYLSWGAGWYAADRLAGRSLFYKYIRSFYWAISTLTVVDNGDSFPRTPEETAYTLVCVVL